MISTKAVFEVDRPSFPCEDSEVRKYYEFVIARELLRKNLTVDHTNLDTPTKIRIRSLMELNITLN